jgi:inosine/xanthosine triphosphatase
LIISIGSKNKVKTAAVEEAFQICFPKSEKKFSNYKIKNTISSMPKSRIELIEGANERAQLALTEKLKELKNNEKKSDLFIYGVGLEGGISFEKSISKWFLEGWVAIIHEKTNYISYGRTAGMILPDVIVEKVLSGIELADVMDEISGLSNTREKDGAFGILTNNLFTRFDSFKEAIILACAPFYQNFESNNFYELKKE